MTKFYRQASLRIRLINGSKDGYVNTMTISGLRISFSITKSRAWSTNSAVVKIWNLSQENRNLLKNFGDEVTIYAGYELEGGPQLLFIGQTSSVSHVFDFPEIVTTLECGDGEKYLNQLRVSVTYGENTPASIVLRQIATQMDIALLPLPNIENLIYRQGFKFIGMGKDGLTKVCDKFGLSWSVQNNALQVLFPKQSVQQQAIPINENTGMQGIPQRYTYKSLDLYRSIDAPNTGYKVNVALNPFVIPGVPIILSSTHLNFKGPYVVDSVIHQGDTYGFVWSSQLQVTELTQ
jgi:hypothetical protein